MLGAIQGQVNESRAELVVSTPPRSILEPILELS
jgi:hypothetical protein